MRIAVGKMMDSVEKDLNSHVENTTFPLWMLDKFRELKVNGLNI